jgi:hypothetical protein
VTDDAIPDGLAGLRAQLWRLSDDEREDVIGLLEKRRFKEAMSLIAHYVRERDGTEPME